jgi:hypothetical protein
VWYKGSNQISRRATDYHQAPSPDKQIAKIVLESSMRASPEQLFHQKSLFSSNYWGDKLVLFPPSKASVQPELERPASNDEANISLLFMPHLKTPSRHLCVHNNAWIKLSGPSAHGCLLQWSVCLSEYAIHGTDRCMMQLCLLLLMLPPK